MKNIRQVDLCREWKKPPVTVSRIVNGTLQSRQLEKKLARKLGVPVAELRKKNHAIN